MEQYSKDSLVVCAGTILEADGGWMGSSRLAAAYAVALGPWGKFAGGLLGAVAGAALTKKIVSNQGAMPQVEIEEL